MRTHSKEDLLRLTPAGALDILMKGNERFMRNLKANRDLLKQVNETSDGQNPFAVILSCMDSRTSAELIFDQGLGDIFSIRIAGNFVNDDILGSIEYAVCVKKVKLVLVLGHTGCGAVQGAVENVELGHLTGLLAKLKAAVKSTPKEDGSGKPYMDRIAEANVRITMDDIVRRSDEVRSRLERNEVGIAGGIYDVASGQVELLQVSRQLEEVTVAEASAK